MIRTALAAGLALLALSLSAPAQDGPAPAPAPAPAPPAPAPPTPAPPTPEPPPPPPPRPGGGAHVEPIEAPAGPVALPHMAPTMPVEGLKDENAEQVAERLEGFVDTLYVCAACSKAAFEPGSCCDAERAASRGPAIASAAANPANESVSFIVTSGRRVRLTDFERLLAPLHVQVLRDRLKVPAGVTLFLEGLPEDPAGSTALRAALTAPHLLEEFDVERAGADRAQIVVRRVAVTPPTLATLIDALAAANPSLRISDVAWSGTPHG